MKLENFFKNQNLPRYVDFLILDTKVDFIGGF